MRDSIGKIVISAARVVACASVALCAVYLFRWGEFSSICLDSQIVDRFILFSEQTEISRCGDGYSTVMGTSRLPKPVRVTQSFASLDGLLNVWPAPAHSITVAVSGSEQMSFFSDSRVVVIGAVPAQTKSQIQTAVLISWLKQLNPHTDDFSRRVLTDFLRSVANKKFELESLDGSFPSLGKVRFGDLPTRVDEYCQLPWRAIDEIENCESLGIASLRPVLANSLWLIYENLSWRERRNFWAWLRSSALLTNEFLPIDIKAGESHALLKVLRYWLSQTVDADRRDSLFASISQKLNLRSIHTPLVGIVGGDSLPEMPLIHRPVLVNLNGAWFWKSQYGTFRSDVEKPEVRHLVAFGCQPSPGRSAMSSAKITVLLASRCDLSSQVQMEELLKGDMAGFISSNLSLGIIWLNAAVLRTKLGRSLPNQILAERLTLRRLRKIEPWREDRWDEALRAFRPQSQTVELVLSHRASRDLL